MSKRNGVVFIACGLVLSLASGALAHPGHIGHGLEGGFMHPLSGLDHLLAMIAVGLWAAQVGGRAVWALPAAFVGCMLVGGAIGLSSIELPMIEAGILASVLVLGLMVTLAAKLPLSVSLCIVALFALCHGYAHGHELPGGASAAEFAIGFSLATALLHAAGIGLAMIVGRQAKPVWVRACGLAVLIGGAMLASGVL
ncbi:MAG: urease accessory protein UreJ [Planctomycetes bacterium]|nr:urease accessory protein UreJ [Planctomycetota bacterium]